MDGYKEDITQLRNFKSAHSLKRMVVHFHEKNMDVTPDWIYVANSIEKLIVGCELSYMLGDSDFEVGLYPLVTTNSLYLIEYKNDGEDCLRQIEYYKRRVTEIKNKLSSKNFIEKASDLAVDLERKKLIDFNRRWELATIGYMFV